MDKGIQQLSAFAKGGGPYIGPKGGKYADPQHKIPWTDKTEKPDRPGRDREKEARIKGEEKEWRGKETASQTAARSATATRYKREAQTGQRAHAEKQQEVDMNVQSALKDMRGWGGVAWKNLSAVMQGKLKKLGLVEENAARKGTFVLNEKGKALAAKVKKSESTMNGIEELEMFAKGNGAMPSGESKFGSGEEEGGKLEGVGKTGGTGDSAPGTPIAAEKEKKDKLSEDDAEEEKAMKEHKKPIETIKRSFDTTAQGQRDSLAHDHAVVVSQLQKGEEDVVLGVGQPREKPAPEKFEKSEWSPHPESRVIYSSGGLDDMTAELAKSEGFYHGGRPVVSPELGIMHSVKCSACGDTMSKALTACPNCGEGTAKPGVEYVHEGAYVDKE